MTGKVFFVALETSSSMYLRIISLNHPHLQLVTPLWPLIPLQPHRLHNHPHPIAIHTHQPHTSLQPHTTQNHTHSMYTITHTLQNHQHPSNCPHPSTTHLNHTYPPTTHIPSNHPHLMPVHIVQMNTLEQDDPDTWKALMSTNFVVVKLNVLFTYLFTDHTLAQDVKMLKRHSWMVGVKMELL